MDPEPTPPGLRRAFALQAFTCAEDVAQHYGDERTIAFLRGFRAALHWENKVDEIRAMIAQHEAQVQAASVQNQILQVSAEAALADDPEKQSTVRRPRSKKIKVDHEESPTPGTEKHEAKPAKLSRSEAIKAGWARRRERLGAKKPLNPKFAPEDDVQDKENSPRKISVDQDEDGELDPHEKRIINYLESEGPQETGDLAALIDRSTFSTQQILNKLAERDLIQANGKKWEAI